MIIWLMQRSLQHCLSVIQLTTLQRLGKPANLMVRVDTLGSSFGDTILSAYQATGSGFAGLNFISCASYGNSITLSLQAGIMYYLQAGDIYGGGGDLHVNLQELPPPANDTFSSAP